MDKEIISIEMQDSDFSYMIKKSLYYASILISRPIPHGEEDEKIPKVVMINILNFNLFMNNKKGMSKPHWIFNFKEKSINKKKGTKELLIIHFIELPKYKEYEKEHKNKMINNDPWILFLSNPYDNYFKKHDTLKVFIDAREQLIHLQSNPEYNEI